jgi:hypothetical protein
VFGAREDRRKVAPVAIRDRQRIEFRDRDDVVGNQPVLRDPSRPSAGIECQQANEWAWCGRERNRRGPDWMGGWLELIVDAKVNECRRKGRRRALFERPLPEFLRQLRQELLANFPGRFGTLLEEAKDVEHKT